MCYFTTTPRDVALPRVTWYSIFIELEVHSGIPTEYNLMPDMLEIEKKAIVLELFT